MKVISDEPTGVVGNGAAVAARRWRFSPPRRDGRNVKGRHVERGDPTEAIPLLEEAQHLSFRLDVENDLSQVLQAAESVNQQVFMGEKDKEEKS